jgi:hypothetical protein
MAGMSFAGSHFAVSETKETRKDALGPDTSSQQPATDAKPVKRRRWRRAGLILAALAALLLIARGTLPIWVRWYVNRKIDQSPLYDGQIGEIDIHLWKGAYSIHDIRLNKTTGNVPLPLFWAKRVDFSLQWNALSKRRFVGQMFLQEPQINFIAAQDDSRSQTGIGGPWLKIIRDLSPFKVNEAIVRNGSIHFRAIDAEPPVDVYLSYVDGQIKNLTNIDDQLTPLASTVSFRALAMDQAKVEYEMKLDPFSYRPTFQLATRMLALDVEKLNALAKAYGGFTFEAGWFDLVIEADAKEGGIEGYVKPLFRNLVIFDPRKDAADGNLLQLFWEALVGATAEIFKNQRRDQFGTRIRFTGELRDSQINLIEVIGNVLRNAFVRAYLPRLRHVAPDISELQFDPGDVSDEPIAIEQ